MAHFDNRQLTQIAYHLVKAGLNSKNASDETKTELAKLIDFANKFHRIDECGKLVNRIATQPRAAAKPPRKDNENENY